MGRKPHRSDNSTSAVFHRTPCSTLVYHIANSLTGPDAQKAIDARHEAAKTKKSSRRRREIPEHIKRNIRMDAAEHGADVMLLAYQYKLDPSEIREILK